MNSLREELLDTGKSYFDELIRSVLLKQRLLENSLVCISGSVAYGYCDNLSDIEIEICFKEWPSETKSRELEKVIMSNPKFNGVRMGASLTPGWKLDLVLRNQMKEFWKEFDPYVLFEITHALPVWDPMKALETMRSRVSFYPRPIFLKVVRGLWLTANDHGAYNADFAARRGNETAANIFLFRGVEALLRLIFILNRKYYPRTKWIVAEMVKLEETFHSESYLEKINPGEMFDRQRAFNSFIGEVREYLLKKDKIISPMYVEDPWKLINQPYFIHSTF